jgi:hypothetical protein
MNHPSPMDKSSLQETGVSNVENIAGELLRERRVARQSQREAFVSLARDLGVAPGTGRPRANGWLGRVALAEAQLDP